MRHGIFFYSVHLSAPLHVCVIFEGKTITDRPYCIRLLDCSQVIHLASRRGTKRSGRISFGLMRFCNLWLVAMAAGFTSDRVIRSACSKGEGPAASAKIRLVRSQPMKSMCMISLR